MRISTRSRYGARAMAELAAVYPERPVPVKELAENQRLSAKYLEQILTRLRAAGLVRAVRGPRGGYTLGAPPESISLRSIFGVLEGQPMLLECLGDPDSCPMRADCPTRDTWVELSESIDRVLRNTSVRDLAERLRPRSRQPVPTYQI